MNLVVHDDMPLDPLEETLVSYLDGELQGPERAALERQLDSDAALRSRLQAMQRAWDLLDNLDVVEGSEKFARTTVEMVAVKTAEDLAKPVSTVSRPWLRIAVASGATLATALIAFVVVRQFTTAEDRQLVRDLPVIEKLDEYQSMPSFEFLKRLDQEKVFAEEANNGSH